MSFDVSLEKDGEPVYVKRHSEGGTYALGGIDYADLNITYNYSPFYFEHLDVDKGLRWINGKQAKETIEKLTNAVSILGTGRVNDYWAATSGNAGYALSILLHWGKQHPDAIWNVC